MAASSRKLAALMASRLARVVPPPFAIGATDSGVGVYIGREALTLLGGSNAASIVEDDDDRTAGERIESAVAAIMDGVQDCVAEELREPWPSLDRVTMALPNTRRDEKRICMWFGEDERAPVVALSPIEIADLEDD